MDRAAIVQKHLAGEEGLEPSHAGIKIQCLYQLGDSPTLDFRRPEDRKKHRELSAKKKAFSKIGPIF
jgi:hypothetical protein